MAKILIVEDDIMTANMIRDLVESFGHTGEVVYNGDDGLDRLRFYQYDLVVLDWQMSGKSGIELLTSFRQMGGRTAVLMLTGKNTIHDKEQGFGSGADDYLTKPFDVRELKLRIQALLRRPSDFVEPALSQNGYSLDFQNHSLIKNGEPIALLPKEFAVIEFLFRHQNQYFLPETLLNKVWPSESDATLDALRSCIKRIRKKVDNENEPSIISTSRGYGYKLEFDSSSTSSGDASDEEQTET